jgi:hypothetical protein
MFEERSSFFRSADLPNSVDQQSDVARFFAATAIDHRIF